MHDQQPCRTCGRPRGENIADGTRCTACGHRQGVVLCLSLTVAASLWMRPELDARWSVATLVAALLAAPPALFAAVLLHELAHAAAATLLGQRVTRVLVGEGTALWRLGRDPQLVVGTVVLGNGLTNVADLRPRGYRRRMAVMLLAAPVVSALLAVATYSLTSGWSPVARTAAVLFAGANALMAVITSIPVATFGGRVWSDVASVIYLARADRARLDEHMLLLAQDRVALLLAEGLHPRAVETGRAALAAAPATGLAHSLLAFCLHQAGQYAEAREIARARLEVETDPSARAYLTGFVADDGRELQKR